VHDLGRWGHQKQQIVWYCSMYIVPLLVYSSGCSFSARHLHAALSWMEIFKFDSDAMCAYSHSKDLDPLGDSQLFVCVLAVPF